MQSYHDRLLQRALRAFGDLPPSEAIAKTRAITGPGGIPASEALAVSAMKKLRHFIAPTQEEVLALEYVIRIMRPAPLTRDGLLDPLDDGAGDVHPPATVGRWNTFRVNVQSILRSVGRIDHLQLGHMGTGFLIGPGLLATNAHVLTFLTQGTGILAPGSARVRFNCELGAQEPAPTRASILGVAAVHPELDIALLQIEENADRVSLSLDLDTQVEEGHPIVVVGYPAESSASNPLFQEAIFKGKFGVRRGALGEVLSAQAPVLHHDCTTLGGNSGSPIFSLQSEKVIGIHSSGTFTYRNDGVTAREIDKARPR
ncbi:MAG TPA: serine protease [Prosthecobacter sp.]